jgi:DNA-directed RNA polymerase subunit delta|tara:strand:- start:2495 stop:2725 length:231 start_codon:yes stop_codon:yes gene_type:complete
MKRVIVDNNKLTNQILDLLIKKFPDGYDYDDVISFKNVKKKEVRAVEVRTEDTIFLVKISSELEDSMEAYLITLEK